MYFKKTKHCCFKFKKFLTLGAKGINLDEYISIRKIDIFYARLFSSDSRYSGIVKLESRLG